MSNQREQPCIALGYSLEVIKKKMHDGTRTIKIVYVDIDSTGQVIVEDPNKFPYLRPFAGLLCEGQTAIMIIFNKDLLPCLREKFSKKAKIIYLGGKMYCAPLPENYDRGFTYVLLPHLSISLRQEHLTNDILQFVNVIKFARKLLRFPEQELRIVWNDVSDPDRYAFLRNLYLFHDEEIPEPIEFDNWDQLSDPLTLIDPKETIDCFIGEINHKKEIFFHSCKGICTCDGATFRLLMRINPKKTMHIIQDIVRAAVCNLLKLSALAQIGGDFNDAP